MHPSNTIWYFLPDYENPSWGGGMLYHHVYLLNRNGYKAILLHEKFPFKLAWLDQDIPIRYLDQRDMTFSVRDIVVVPEGYASDTRILNSRARKIVFIQNCFLIFLALEEPYSYTELTYEHAFTYLPHLHRVIRRHFNIKTTDIPPFVAPYFFMRPDGLMSSPRKKQIVLFPKAGSYDYDIVLKMLYKKLNYSDIMHNGWNIVELKQKRHKEVAEIFKESAFFVCLNTHEAFNSSVPEAMAAGCIVICYDAFGPKDFLKDKENAFVFPNHHIYPLVDKLYELIENYNNLQDVLNKMRLAAYQTACHFTRQKTEKALVEFFKCF